ncbi:sulfotransferase domain-containing protein [Thermoleptolyngbya sp. C42_A2020_037]|uniref:sulfotransferase domain-containing protein n=1 Tax=Thermoleptolyngbya sp. C42_A2020_037 TaxID=2747799 RepID=UPI0019F0B66F|nr:sulfotransferase domain-containing protein [Thermoleptolyngbya sp. C42_A2020_037]MBF2086428.1 sulfotransferase domain-containing protein [Thermoleptolyngbya sp. C42_A2020_037]
MTSSADRPILIYTVHKAASMFLHRLTRQIARELEMEYFTINNKAAGYQEVKELSWNGFIQKYLSQAEKRACFGPIRSLEAMPSIPEGVADFSIILHLRDPRDVLVSSFFSNAFSHPVNPAIFNPDEAARQEWIERGIDAFVIERSPVVIDRYNYVIANLLGRENVLFLKYEDMVLNYQEWLAKFLSVFIAPEPNVPTEIQPKGLLALLEKLPLVQRKERSPSPTFSTLYQELFEAHKTDFQVEDEDVYRHKRQVLPGDHTRKLQPETIAVLNEKFAEILNALGYEPVANSRIR